MKAGSLTSEEVSDGGSNESSSVGEEDDVSEDDGVITSESESSEEEDSFGNVDPHSRFIAKNGEEWSATPITATQGRHRKENILKEQAGPSRFLVNQAVTPKGAFLAFITREICTIIARHTNEEGRRKYGLNWRDTNTEEIVKYIGATLLAGVFRARFEPIRNLWDKESGRPFFAAAMSRHRFEELTSCLRFDSKEDRPERRERDKLAPIRVVCDKVAANFRAGYKAGSGYCIDEQLLAFRGRCPFKVYIPTKPSKYGIKKWIAADVETSYCLNFQVYVGKVGRLPEIGQGARVAVELSDFMAGSGRNCTADNFFSSLTLSRALLSRGITFVGTVRKNKTFLPPCITNTQGRNVLSSKFAFQKGCTLVSYIPKKGKNVLLMSSLHDQGYKDDSRDDQKPDIILDYNHGKGAVDNLDKLVRTYSVVRKSRRWPMVVFGNLVDLAAYNAYVVFHAIWPDYQKNRSHRRRLFLVALATEMMASDSQPSQYVARIPLAVDNEQKKRGRCVFCPRTLDKKTCEYCAVWQQCVSKSFSPTVLRLSILIILYCSMGRVQCSNISACVCVY